MSVHCFKDLLRHAGHAIVCVPYGTNDMTHNVAVECLTCNEVLLDFDNDLLSDVETAVILAEAEKKLEDSMEEYPTIVDGQDEYGSVD